MINRAKVRIQTPRKSIKCGARDRGRRCGRVNAGKISYDAKWRFPRKRISARIVGYETEYRANARRRPPAERDKERTICWQKIQWFIFALHIRQWNEALCSGAFVCSRVRVYDPARYYRCALGRFHISRAIASSQVIDQSQSIIFRSSRKQLDVIHQILARLVLNQP